MDSKIGLDYIVDNPDYCNKLASGKKILHIFILWHKRRNLFLQNKIPHDAPRNFACIRRLNYANNREWRCSRDFGYNFYFYFFFLLSFFISDPGWEEKWRERQRIDRYRFFLTISRVYFRKNIKIDGFKKKRSKIIERIRGITF